MYSMNKQYHTIPYYTIQVVHEFNLTEEEILERRRLMSTEYKEELFESSTKEKRLAYINTI